MKYRHGNPTWYLPCPVTNWLDRASIRHRHILPFYGACFAATQVLISGPIDKGGYLILLQPFIISSLCHYGNVRQFLQIFPESDRVTMVRPLKPNASTEGKN